MNGTETSTKTTTTTYRHRMREDEEEIDDWEKIRKADRQVELQHDFIEVKS